MRYRRTDIIGENHLFRTERHQRLLTDHIDVLRQAAKRAKPRHPPEIDTMLVLTDHIHTKQRAGDQSQSFSFVTERLYRKGTILSFSTQLTVCFLLKRLI